MTARTTKARPAPRPLPATLEQGIRSLENRIFNTYSSGPERNDAFKRLWELAEVLGRMTTRAELAAAEAEARNSAAADAVEEGA